MNRLANIELLRVTSMVGIVLFHMFYHGNYNVEIESVNNAFVRYVQVLGEVGVNVFVLITGYFLSSKIKLGFDYKRVLKFVSLLAFYSFFLAVFTALFNLTDVSSPNLLLTAIFPDKWWFATTYLFLLLLIPVLNFILQKSHKLFLGIILLYACLILCITPTMIPSAFGEFIIRNLLIVNVMWFSYLFLIAGYIRFYEEDFSVSPKRLMFLILLFTLLEIVVTNYLMNRYDLPMFGKNVPYYYDKYYFPTFVLSVFIFLLFKNISFHSVWINKIASVVFDVYLISDYPVIRECLWMNVFNMSAYQQKWYFIPLSIAIAILVYCVCSCIGFVRLNIFGLKGQGRKG